MVYVRYKGAANFEEELLFCSPLKLGSHGIYVYNEVNKYFNLQCLNSALFSVSLDGGPVILDHINSFSDFIQENMSNIEVTHCMIHRHALMVNYLEPILEAVMHVVIKIVNFIRGDVLNTRLFHELCQDGEDEYTDLL